MASKAEAKAKMKRKPAQMDDQTAEEIQAAIDEDRMEDPNQKKEVNANTDDEGNPIATKDSISMAKGRTRQMMDDQQEYYNKTVLPREEAKAKALAAKKKGN